MLPMEIVDHAYQRNNFVQRHLGYTNDSDSVRYFLKLNNHLDISINKVEILSKEAPWVENRRIDLSLPILLASMIYTSSLGPISFLVEMCLIFSSFACSSA